jgi:hypothetical protein
MQESGEIYVNDNDNTNNNNHSDTGNAILDAQAQTQKRHGIHYHPTALVNDLPLGVQAHDAVVSTSTLFRALCSALQHGNTGAALPPLCFNCEWCHDVVGCLQHGGSCEDAWKQQRADEKKRRDDKKHGGGDGDGHNNKPPAARSEGLVHHFFRLLFLMAVLGMLSYGGWHYYTSRFRDSDRNPFGRRGRGGDGNSFLGNYIPLSSGGGDGGANSGLFGGGASGGGDSGEGTVQFLSG